MWEPSSNNSRGILGLLSLGTFFFLLSLNLIHKRTFDNFEYTILILSGFLGIRYGIYYQGYFSNRDWVRRNILGATFSNICVSLLFVMPWSWGNLSFIYVLLAIAIWLLILYLHLRYGNGIIGARFRDDIYSSHCEYVRPPFWRKKERKRYDLDEKERKKI